MIEEARTSVSISSLEENELKEADRTFRLAFGTFLGLPDSLAFESRCVKVEERPPLDALQPTQPSPLGTPSAQA